MKVKSTLGVVARVAAIASALTLGAGGAVSSASGAGDQSAGRRTDAWMVVHTTDGIDDPFESNIGGVR